MSSKSPERLNSFIPPFHHEGTRYAHQRLREAPRLRGLPPLVDLSIRDSPGIDRVQQGSRTRDSRV